MVYINILKFRSDWLVQPLIDGLIVLQSLKNTFKKFKNYLQYFLNKYLIVDSLTYTLI